MKFSIKPLRIISMLLIVVMLIPSNLVYAKTKNSNVEDLDRCYDDGMYKDSSNLKVGKTKTYRFKTCSEHQILILFQAEDESAYSINVYNSKGKKVASNKKCKKTWRKVITIPSGIHKIEIKALKESAYTLNVKYKGGDSFRTKPNGKEREFDEYYMGSVCSLDGTLIEPIVSGGKWVILEPHEYKKKEKSELGGIPVPDWCHQDTYYKIKTISKSKIYKVDENSPKGEYIYYLKDNCLYKYYLEDSSYYDPICDEIYDYDYKSYNDDVDATLIISCINNSDKTIKKIILNMSDSKENYENGLIQKISIPIVLFSKKYGETHVHIDNSDYDYLNSIQFVYLDDTTKSYDIDDFIYLRTWRIE